MWRWVIIAVVAWLLLVPALFVPYATAIMLRERAERRRHTAVDAEPSLDPPTLEASEADRP
jgi:hypothetical protein